MEWKTALATFTITLISFTNTFYENIVILIILFSKQIAYRNTTKHSKFLMLDDSNGAFRKDSLYMIMGV